ncbi:MAG TPA: ABC transporter permease [Plantibacter sp.]|uniref:ABC transporter permease n=1 Tax=unclassified Plantibacter TaxID=2624265 RepID=UPI002C2FEB4B|nr:ABC transporter permease [Plantibacter sp.]
MRSRPVLLGLAVVGYAVMIVPILFVVVSSFTAGKTLSFPPQGFSLQWFEKALSYTPFIDALGSSVLLAIVSTILALGFGVPVALGIARGRMRSAPIIQSFFVSPLIVPELVIGLALYQQVMITLRLDSFVALLIGHIVILLPYTVRVTGATLALSDTSIEDAARGLGAGPWHTFRTVTLPLMRPGLISAALLSFITSFNNVPLSLLLQSREFRTFPVTMLDYVQQSYDPMIAAMSTLIMAGTVVIAIIAERTVGFARIFGGINQ